MSLRDADERALKHPTARDGHGAGNGQPAGRRALALSGGAEGERAELDARIDALGQGDRTLPRRHAGEHRLDMAHLQTGLRRDPFHRQAYHAAGDGNLCRSEADGVQHDEARPLAPRAAAQRGRRELGHEGVLIAQDVAGRANAARHAGIALGGERHQAVAHKVAQVTRISIALILTPGLTGDLQIAHELAMRAVHQGADDDVATSRNARKARGARTLDGVHEERLRAIARRVRGEDARRGAGRAGLSRELAHVAARRGVAHITRGGLEVAPAQIGEVGVLHAQGQPQALTQIAHEGLVAVGGFTAKMMVHMQHVQPLAGNAGAAAPVVDVELAGAGHQGQCR